MKNLSKKSAVQIFSVAAACAILLRFLLVSRGYNADMFTIFAIARAPIGTNYYSAYPYSANWGPIPYFLFQIFERLPGGNEVQGFHYYVTALFTCCDLWTAWVLFSVFGLMSSLIYLFSPTAVILAGYHCNAEPAIVAGACLALWAGTKAATLEKLSDRKAILVAAGIALSMSMKHVFAFFPLWLAMRPQPRSRKLLWLFVPYAMYGLIILPFFIADPAAFIKNVLLYRGWIGNGLIPFRLDPILTWLGAPAFFISAYRLPLFILSLLGVGYLARRLDFKQQFMLYFPALVGLSPSVALQYLVPPGVSFAAFPQLLTLLYQGFVAWQFGGHPEELHLYELPAQFVDHQYNRGWMFLQALCILFVILSLRAFRSRQQELKH